MADFYNKEFTFFNADSYRDNYSNSFDNRGEYDVDNIGDETPWLRAGESTVDAEPKTAMAKIWEILGTVWKFFAGLFVWVYNNLVAGINKLRGKS